MSSAVQALTDAKFKNLLIATDFSSCADSAMPIAAAIARQFQSKVHILHVLGRESTDFISKPGASKHRQCEQALEQLQILSHTEPFKDILCHLVVQPGDVADIVFELAVNLNIDLIVLGTHGRRGIKHLVMGSVAEQIMHRAMCAVLTIGPHMQSSGMARGAINSIVYATRFSPGSVHALDYAISFARAHPCRLIVFHGVPIEAVGARTDLQELIRRTKKRLEDLIPKDIEHELVIGSSPAADGILQLATERGADLIVMGARSRALGEAPWATTHRVVCGAECPVLTVRA